MTYNHFWFPCRNEQARSRRKYFQPVTQISLPMYRRQATEQRKVFQNRCPSDMHVDGGLSKPNSQNSQALVTKQEMQHISLNRIHDCKHYIKTIGYGQGTSRMPMEYCKQVWSINRHAAGYFSWKPYSSLNLE